MPDLATATMAIQCIHPRQLTRVALQLQRIHRPDACAVGAPRAAAAAVRRPRRYHWHTMSLYSFCVNICVHRSLAGQSPHAFTAATGTTHFHSDRRQRNTHRARVLGAHTRPCPSSPHRERRQTDGDTLNSFCKLKLRRGCCRV